MTSMCKVLCSNESNSNFFLDTNETNIEEGNVEHTELLGFLFKLIVPQQVSYLKAFSITQN